MGSEHPGTDERSGLETGVSEAPARRLYYRYDDIEDAPAQHRRIARYTVYTTKPEIIAKALRIGLNTVRQVLKHPPIAEWIQAQQALKRVERHENLDFLTAARSEAFRQINDRIQGRELNDAQLLRVATFVCDRHPDGQFIKKSKTEVNSVHTIVTPELIESMRTRAKELGVTAAIDVQATPSLEADVFSDEDDDMEGIFDD